MIIHSNIKDSLETELKQAKAVWIASAMISYSGWLFLQKSIPKSAIQTYLIGIDLATDPKVFESLLANLAVNSRVYETQYTFHPKVYLIQYEDDSLTAFIGSSNTTSWGLEKNVEMNFRLDDQKECKKLLAWFNALFSEGHFITQSFADDYKAKFQSASIKAKEINKEAEVIKSDLKIGSNQFFSRNHHAVFNKKYHAVENENLKAIRKAVGIRLKELHAIIYPQFNAYGLTDLHCHHSKREIVSRYFFNNYSGFYINAMWLHYGKSLAQLQAYSSADKSFNKPDSFINNIRMQVIIHEDSLGIWLVLGRNSGSRIDREYFRNQMRNPTVQKKFYDAFKKLGNDYWIDVPNAPKAKDIKSHIDLWKATQKESLEEYFIIGCDIDWLDNRLSEKNLPKTVLEEFRKLYPLYEIMGHK
ncbi:MAG: phospholipase D-like domain-containing protein [Allomuricauda sp.]